MRLIRVLIQKKQEYENMYIKNKKIRFAYEEHLSQYMMALAYLKMFDPLILKKIQIWKRFTSTTGETQMNYYRKLLSFYKDEVDVIIKALKTIEERRDEEIESGMGTIWKPLTWGVLAYEMEGE